MKYARGNVQKQEQTSAHAQENSGNMITEASKRESQSHKRSEALTHAQSPCSRISYESVRINLKLNVLSLRTGAES